MDPTTLRAAVDRLIAQHLDLDIWPTARRAEIRAAVDTLNLADEIRAELNQIRETVRDRITARGARAKRCASCRDWFADESPTRPTLYCSNECKDARRYR